MLATKMRLPPLSRTARPRPSMANTKQVNKPFPSSPRTAGPGWVFPRDCRHGGRGMKCPVCRGWVFYPAAADSTNSQAPQPVEGLPRPTLSKDLAPLPSSPLPFLCRPKGPRQRKQAPPAPLAHQHGEKQPLRTMCFLYCRSWSWPHRYAHGGLPKTRAWLTSRPQMGGQLILSRPPQAPRP